MASKIRGTRNKPIVDVVCRFKERRERRNLKEYGVAHVPSEVWWATEEYAATHKVTLAQALESLCADEGVDVSGFDEKLKIASKKCRRKAKQRAKKSSDARPNKKGFTFITIYQGGAPGLGRRR